MKSGEERREPKHTQRYYVNAALGTFRQERVTESEWGRKYADTAHARLLAAGYTDVDRATFLAFAHAHPKGRDLIVPLNGITVRLLERYAEDRGVTLKEAARRILTSFAQETVRLAHPEWTE